MRRPPYLRTGRQWLSLNWKNAACNNNMVSPTHPVIHCLNETKGRDVTTQDPRSAELIRAHSTLAQEALRSQQEMNREMREKHPELSTPAKEAAGTEATYEYKIKLEYKSAGVLFLYVEFLDSNGRVVGIFEGSAPGALGIGVCWGSALLQYRIENILGWQASFGFVFSTGVCSITWTGMGFEHIGTAVAAGGSTGVVGLFGLGTFKKPQ